jgi:hypothetical protein
MTDSDNPKSPYSANDPRNPRNPTDQKFPNDPRDPKNPKNPFGPGGPFDPEKRKKVLHSPTSQTPEQGTEDKRESHRESQSPHQHHKNFLQAADLKALSQNKGKVKLQDRELILKEPSATDSRFQEIINEPTLTVTPLGKPSKSGDCEYELKSATRVLTIKVSSKNKS